MYHGMPYDMKLRVVAKRADRPMVAVVAVWTCLLDAASQHTHRGTIEIDEESIAVSMGIELEDVECIMDAFRSKGLLGDDDRLTGWDKRQHMTATERSRKHRSKAKEAAGNAGQRQATARNARERKNPPDNRVQTTEDRITDLEGEDQKNRISDQKNRARAEKRESEREKQSGQTFTDQTADEMLQIWNAEVQSKLTNGHKASLTPKRRKQMQSRWEQDFQRDIRAWRYFCEVIAASDFCMGRIEGKHWTIDLGWATDSSEHVAKVLEGGFSGGKHPPKPSVCEMAELQPAWDRVLQAFQHHFSVAACRSWMSGLRVIALKPRPEGGTTVVLRGPSRFVCQWVDQHYRDHLARWWAEATAGDARVLAVELITEAA